MPDDFFRIRLVATLLETCGIFFNRGQSGKKLDYFLSFFQYYIYTKDMLPMDIEFIVQDVFALTRPQWKLASNLEEASRAFQLAITQNAKTSGLDKVPEPEDPDSDGGSDDEMNDNETDVNMPDGDADQESESDDELDANANSDTIPSVDASDSEEENIVVTRQEEEVDPEEQADFDREFAKMMADSLDSRKHERKPTFDVPLPMRRKDLPSGNDVIADESANGNATPPGTMAFSLLTKRGNRPQVCFHVFSCYLP
jgi:regulator of nonsense transcripts 2